jgi:hypothetical protein
MDVPALRRFPSVTFLKVVCLVELVKDDNVYKIAHKLNAGVAAKIVPLITSLTALRKIYLGGYESGKQGGFVAYRLLGVGDGFDHNDEELLSDAEKADREVVFRGLVEALGAAFESRAISQNLKIEGISLVNQINCSSTEDQQDAVGKQVCRTCSRFCTNFPFENVLELPCWGYLSDWDWNICVDREKVCKIIKSRPGGNDAIKSKRAGLLALDWISEFVDTSAAIPVFDSDIEKEDIREFFEGVHEILEDMLSWGYSLSEVTYSDVLRILPSLSKPKEIRIWEKGLGLGQFQKKTLKNVWASQDQIELLVKLRLPIEVDWYEYRSLE